jgi:hypothetical protein
VDAVPVKIALVNALYQYLLSRPMGEVEGLVTGLRAIEKPLDVPDENTASDRVVSCMLSAA